MTEHPIIFSGEMIRAILANRKSQTRRVIRLPGSDWEPCMRPISWGPQQEDNYWPFYTMVDPGGTAGTGICCPYGQPGSVLWVREAFAVQPEIWAVHHGPQPVHRLATSRREEIEDYVGKPSIHMPRWACRLLLEVTEVRVQRVQEISPEDVLAEGAPGLWPLTFEQPTDGTICGPQGSPERQRAFAAANNLIMFRNLWDSINGKRPGCAWDNNPWVWATSFRRLANER